MELSCSMKGLCHTFIQDLSYFVIVTRVEIIRSVYRYSARPSDITTSFLLSKFSAFVLQKRNFRCAPIESPYKNKMLSRTHLNESLLAPQPPVPFEFTSTPASHTFVRDRMK